MGIKNKGLIINLRVEPRSSRAGISGTHGDVLKVKLNSPPVGGKANRELIDILAREFNIRKKDIEIISGKKSKNKTVRLHGVEVIENKRRGK
jgi:uncharacterized protein (TIGR00251 family)